MSSVQRRRRLELHSRRVGGRFFIEIYLISIVAVIRRLLISIVLVCLGAGGEFL